MNMKNRFSGKYTAQLLTVLCLICILLTVACRSQEREADPLAPPQDGDGYFLLSTEEDFRWFISRDRDPYTNVRLANDLILNDTKGWENWADSPPENSYGAIPSYHGHFDGNGHALEGYHTPYGKWLAPLFSILEEDARVTDLTIRNSLFQTTYEDCVYKDADGKTDVVTASALCFANYGVIENCEVQAKVTGAWDAGGIVGINYGQITGCKFTGTVEAGTDPRTQAPENTYTKQALFAGGICRSNQGSIRDCVNEGTVTLDAISETFYVRDFAAGGISGQQSAQGCMEGCRNMGDVTGIELAGGIAGASRGSIYKCQNSGKVHIRQVEREYVETLISAGICASNGGIVDTCVNTGSVTINQKSLSFCSPIYGIACNTVNPGKGQIENSFYLEEKALQDYPQRGVRKLKTDELTRFSPYFSGEKRLEKTDFTDFLAFVPYGPETDRDDPDYVHLAFGPPEDVVYKVAPGDNLWNIAKQYYGDGRYYGNLIWKNPALEEGPLLPGMEIIIPHRDLAAVRRYDEEGFDFAYCRLPSGESCPTRFVLSKPINWYYGTMEFAAAPGLETLWPKTPDAAQSEDIRVFYRVDANPDGDFFEGRWPQAQESIRRSAAAYWGNSVDTFEFDHYTLAEGESLYCYSFVVYKKGEKLVCQAAYRLCENMLVEFIGVQPLRPHEGIGQSHDVQLRVPYMAAFADTTVKLEEPRFHQETFYGRENWDFPQLHNPFAIALAYDKNAECSPYMLFTGAQ
ncbi:MAG: LysM peptidoglycan-binding domain-containing protein [Hungatella sp.]|nr:LysM peptidoglycan-binding domain-containing protein [Hungatella sp.]